ncbi:hypothetical protein G9A89_018809 [Geosiphon pyriformis]|nr:hypothetical protein G9A89_018809 [Geosiphon pyriformis]
MTYVPIAKLERFTSKENNAQVWLNNVEKAIAANKWNDVRAILVNKPQDFNAFKLEFLQYFSNNNSINWLANTFTTIKQGETKAVITYLRHFHRNLCQIQAIDMNYFTAPQILNQFICGLCSNFEFTELEANHTQAINLVINRLSELDSKLKQFISNSKVSTQPRNISIKLPTSNTVSNLSTTHLSNSSTHHLSATVASNISVSTNLNTATKLISNQNTKAENDTTKLEIVIITNNKSLAAIFIFEFEEPSQTPLFSRVALEEKLITAIYTNAKVDSQTIKLILDSDSANSIITQQLINQLSGQVDCAVSARIIIANEVTKTPIGKINDFFIEVNGIIVPIKVLSWNPINTKHSLMLDWTTQKLQLSQNKQSTQVPATCSYFKPSNNMSTLLIEFDDKKEKPTWEAYQIFWANANHNELLPIPS